MNPDAIFEKVKEVIVDQLGVEDEAVKVETAESLASKALDKIGENNLTFYDVQFILTYSGADENNNFPIFGAKKSTSLKVVWSKVK